MCDFPVFFFHSIDGMVKVQNLKKHMERFNKVVNGLKEGKQEMAKKVQELAAAIDALSAKIKVSHQVCAYLCHTIKLKRYISIDSEVAHAITFSGAPSLYSVSKRLYKAFFFIPLVSHGYLNKKFSPFSIS